MKMSNFVEHVLLLLFRDPFEFFLACLAFSFFLQVLGRIAVRDLLKMADSLIPSSMDNLIPSTLSNLIPSPWDLDLSVGLDTVLHLLLITSINIVLVAILLGRRGNTDVVH